MILRVGLTGGIASGKSTIARLLANDGCFTLDADALVADLYQPGHAGHTAIVRTWGAEVLRPDGEIDRKKLADLAFSSPVEVARLNALIHPLVMTEAERRVDAAASGRAGDMIAVVEATLLVEAGGRERYDRIIVVDVDRETQIRRGEERGMTLPDLQRRIASQLSREERLRWADYVIDNSGDEDAAREATTRVLDRLKQDLAAKRASRLR